jgi:rfaE bifunctional protein nucleotidyltransferase chain/domain
LHEILSTGNVQNFLAEIRKKHEDWKIVFTNGIFDIIHRGHVAYLEKAKELGDILVLGLNSDASARRLKGAARPFVNQDDRAFILSRLEAVDIVSVFEEDTPINLIKLVKPDLLVKGGDYQIEEIVGREFVENNGGRVCTIPLVEGKSTTNLLKKVKETYKDNRG